MLKKHTCAVLSYLSRLLDFETVFENQKALLKMISNEITTLLKDGDSEVRRFSMHFAGVVCVQEGFDTEKYFFKAVFINSFYQLQMDIFQDTSRMVALSRIFKANLLRQIQDGEFGADSLLSGEMLNDPNHESIEKRLTIVERELLDCVVSSNMNKNRHILSEGLDVLKLELLRSERTCWLEETDCLSQIINNLVTVLSDHKTKQVSDLDKKVKIKAVEVLAAIIYKGHLPVIQKLTNNCILHVLVDALNNCETQ
jgi:hypothetical protein